MKTVPIFTLCILFSACSTTSAPTFTATGAPGYRISCGGFFGDGDLGSCYQQAGEICQKKGYRVAQTGVNTIIIECKDGSATL